MTQLISARNGIITPQMQASAAAENIDAETLRKRIAEGVAALPMNIKHDNCRATGIGFGLKTKVNANIGTSREHCFLEEEIKKLEVSIEAGADTVMDLSTGGNLDEIRKILISRCPIPLGSVPIYQCVVDLMNEGKSAAELD